MIRNFPGVQGWLGRVEIFSALYLVAKEFVNGCLGSRDLGIYQNTIPNMERDTKESGIKLKDIPEISSWSQGIGSLEVDLSWNLWFVYYESESVSPIVTTSDY